MKLKSSYLAVALVLALGDKIVIGVSGGPDSMCLLYVLNDLKEQLKIKLYVWLFVQIKLIMFKTDILSAL